MREPVRFADGVAALAEAGVGRYLELGPDAVLSAPVAECLEDLDPDGDEPLVACSQRQGQDQAGNLLAFLARAHVDGADLDWGALHEGSGARAVDLPTYAFQRERYWLESRPAADPSVEGLAIAAHPLLHGATQLAERDEWVLSGRISLAAQPWLADHCVFGSVLLPGTGQIDLAASAGRLVGCETIDELTFEVPIVLRPEGSLALQVTVGEPDQSGGREVAIYTRADGPEEEAGEAAWTRHASGSVSPTAADAAAPAPLGAWPPVEATPIDVAALYEMLDEVGFGYGPAFRRAVAAWKRGEETFAEVELDAAASFGQGFTIHPALLDAAGHPTLEFLGAGSGGELPLPFSWSNVTVRQAGASTLRVRITPAGEDAVRIAAFDSAGTPVLSADSVASRPVAASQLRGASRDLSDSLFSIEWAEADEPAEPGPLRFAILGEPPAGAPAADRYPDLEALASAVEAGEPAPDVVVAAAAADPTLEPAAATEHGVGATLELIQAWLACERLGDARLALVTRQAVAVRDDEPRDLAAAAVWALVTSAQAEHPDRFLLLDADEEAIRWEALAAGEESQLASRASALFVPRLRTAREQTLAVPAAEPSWHLDAGEAGMLEGLEIRPDGRAERPLQPDEVRIAVRAAGLNFRDVLITLGQYPGRASIGSEAAGTVLEVGAAVADLAAGDRVLGTMDDAFGPLAVTQRHRVTPIPAGWSFVDAAAVPITFLTAYYALVDLAGLGAGETILIHAAAGGVGQAAVQIAAHLGATVFATASPRKWEALEGLGLPPERIASSRDLEFREKFRETSGGRGVDVVLDALAGEFVDASLDLVADGGRFIEMGKADIREPDQVAAGHPGVRYRAFDLVEAEPQRLQEMLRELGALFERGTLRLPPIRTWDIRRSLDAFRHLREGRNIGKVVLTLPRALDPEGTVLISGGTGGLGALVAERLAASEGARHLLLLSRRGAAADGVGELVERLAELGASATVVACDVADREALGGALAAIDPAHPLTAVIHTAGVLDDGVVEKLDRAQVARVLRPKSVGAIQLHELTRSADLAEFVMFSSVSATIGAPGQGNYAAANAFLDALAQRRGAEGLPAQALAWGLWGEAGMGETLGDVDRARLARQGMAPLSNDDGLELLDAARAIGGAALVPIRLDAGALKRQAQAEALPPIFRNLVRAPARSAASGVALAQLASASGVEAERLALDLVRGHIAGVLGYSSPQAVDPERPFKDLGVDSLAAVELRNRLGAATGLRLPATLVFDHPTAAAVAAFLLTKVEGASPGAAQGNGEEARLREALASIPLARLRSAGLLETLLELAAANGDAFSEEAIGEEIDEMDVDDLVQRALETQATQVEAG